ncbi:papain-like cysteine protease family protein [uncultured Thiodictyon sp.]|uniref:papain-like cysteine protease family protein n=1 Tax=uncultured Thiodictyon sp. TaxID=1846217 RepID=UPI0025DC226D|nr:papain-like cysteine protease family protein [uncultured Thiodictyon sp.]
MGKLFLPKETRGLWDAKSKSLTVHCGEDAYVGFQGTNTEIAALQFSAWGSSLGECANEVYNEGQGKRSTRIDTTKPGTLTFTVTAGDKPLAPPITIAIRMRPAYRQMKAEGQIDETACWAACLAWWLRVLPDRPSVAQSEFLNKLGVGLWNKVDGTIRPAGLEHLATKNGYRMKAATIKASQLVDYLGYWPLILGFTASGGFAHMNVLCGYDPSFGTVDTMEPMYPDPIFDSEYQMMGAGDAGVPLFYNTSTGAPYVYTGAVRTGLSLDSFLTSPMKGGTFWVGYPQEYAAKM